MEQLIQVDRILFEWVNTGWSNEFFDAVFPFLRKKENWFPLYVILAAFLIYKYRWQGLLIVVLGAITVALTDQISSSIVKPVFHRLRPCNNADVFDHINVLVHCGSGYSFVSAHASNHFGFAVLMGFLFYRDHRWVLLAGLIWATLISFAQVYCGVHYPFDVISGALLGSLIAYVIFLTGRWVWGKINSDRRKSSGAGPF